MKKYFLLIRIKKRIINRSKIKKVIFCYNHINIEIITHIYSITTIAISITQLLTGSQINLNMVAKVFFMI